MTPVFSGGLVYEYSNEPNNYGLVSIDNLNSTDVTKLGDFDRLKSAFEKTPIPDNDGGYLKDGQASECPPKTNQWEASNDIPPMPDSASKYLETGAGQPRGTDGPSNQYDPENQQAPSDTGTAGPPPTTTNSGELDFFLRLILETSIAAGTNSILYHINTGSSSETSSSSKSDASSRVTSKGKMAMAVIVVTSVAVGLIW